MRTISALKKCRDGIARPIPRRKTRKETVTHFWAQVIRGDTDSCWLWTGRCKEGKHPYGKLWVGTNEVKAHRFSYELHHGAVPNGLCVLHKCDNPKCVNPVHLFPGTRGDNNRDAATKGRTMHGENHLCAILTEHSVREIRMLYVPRKVSFQKLADKYGVKASCIQGVIERRTWKHVI